MALQLEEAADELGDLVGRGVEGEVTGIEHVNASVGNVAAIRLWFRKYDGFEQKLAASPVISVPTITIGSDFDGANANGAAYAKKFSGH